jgi:hypothetical protein
VGGFVAAVLLRGISPGGVPVHVLTWGLLVVFTASLPLLVIRFIVRSIRARKWVKAVLAAAGLLIALTPVVHAAFPSDEVKIETAIDEALTSQDPSYCSEYVTEGFLEQQTKLPAPFADDDCESYAEIRRADSVRIGDVEVDGDRATATVVIEGGRLDGQCVEVELVKQDGDWKVNRILRFVRFDRRAYENAYRDGFAEFGSPPGSGDCAVDRIRRLTNADLQSLVVGRRPGPLPQIAVHCDRGGFERNVIAGYQGPRYEDFPRPVLACIESTVRAASDAELARLTEDVVAYGSLSFDCDRGATLRFMRDYLEDEDDINSAAADCIVRELRERPTAEIVRLTYDDPRYERLIDSCEG